MKRYRIYLANAGTASPDTIELLSASHEDALKSAARLVESRLAAEVWYGSFCIGAVDAQGVVYSEYQATTAGLPDTDAVREGRSRGAS